VVQSLIPLYVHIGKGKGSEYVPQIVETQPCQTSPEEYKRQSISQIAMLDPDIKMKKVLLRSTEMGTNHWILYAGTACTHNSYTQNSSVVSFFKGYRARKSQSRQLSLSLFSQTS